MNTSYAKNQQGLASNSGQLEQVQKGPKSLSQTKSDVRAHFLTLFAIFVLVSLLVVRMAAAEVQTSERSKLLNVEEQFETVRLVARNTRKELVKYNPKQVQIFNLESVSAEKLDIYKKSSAFYAYRLLDEEWSQLDSCLNSGGACSLWSFESVALKRDDTLTNSRYYVLIDSRTGQTNVMEQILNYSFREEYMEPSYAFQSW